MIELPEFRAFNSIPRLRRDCTITEKIDGTNAIIHVAEDGQVMAGSRTRWITPEKDNHGFAAWVSQHIDELRGLGPGYHYGEFWGPGIQRRYGLAEKRFSLFNVGRWGAGGKDADRKPACCDVVPVLYSGPFTDLAVDTVLEGLRTNGSVVSPGFMRPEGIVVYMNSSRSLYKITFEGDGHKGAA